MKKNLKIGLIGAAGSGKSSIANSVAVELGIRFLAAKDITQPILSRDGYDYSSGIQVERFLATGMRQNEILKRTIRSQKTSNVFITDRTVVDLAAYAVAELHENDHDLLRDIFYKCRDNVSIYTHLFVCPWRDAPIRYNHKRTLNPWYQFQIHAIEIGILKDWNVSCHLFKYGGFEARVREIIEIVKGKGA